MSAPTDVYGYPDYPEMRADFSLPSQYYERYTEDDHAVWRLLYDRQMKLMDRYASKDYLEATVVPSVIGMSFCHNISPVSSPAAICIIHMAVSASLAIIVR